MTMSFTLKYTGCCLRLPRAPAGSWLGSLHVPRPHLGSQLPPANLGRDGEALGAGKNEDLMPPFLLWDWFGSMVIPPPAKQEGWGCGEGRGSPPRGLCASRDISRWMPTTIRVCAAIPRGCGDRRWLCPCPSPPSPARAGDPPRAGGRKLALNILTRGT